MLLPADSNPQPPPPPIFDLCALQNIFHNSIWQTSSLYISIFSLGRSIRFIVVRNVGYFYTDYFIVTVGTLAIKNTKLLLDILTWVFYLEAVF